MAQFGSGIPPPIAGMSAKAVTDDVKKWKLMAIGALGIGGTALGVNIANSFEWFTRIFHK